MIVLTYAVVLGALGIGFSLGVLFTTFAFCLALWRDRNPPSGDRGLPQKIEIPPYAKIGRPK